MFHYLVLSLCTPYPVAAIDPVHVCMHVQERGRVITLSVSMSV